MITIITNETTKAAWSRYYSRQAMKTPADKPQINFAEIISAAENVYWAKQNLFQQRVKNGYRAGEECWVTSKRNQNIREAVDGYEAERKALWTVCSATGVSMYAAVAAARAMLKWYERTEMRHTPDAEKLLSALS